MKKLIQSDFVEKASNIHKNKYDYSNSIYINTRSFIDIICPIHGIFNQQAKVHLRGHGCSKCSGTNKKMPAEEFIKKSAEIHKNKYDYSKVVYNGHYNNIIIICPIHGEFCQNANDHSNGHGCPRCGKTGKLNTKIFIERAKLIHGNIYNYSKVKYIMCRKKVIIICNKHGEFKQNASDHLTGRGCPICKMSGISNLSQKWLEEMGIIKENREVKIIASNKIYIVDGIDHDNKIIYEFNGDFWHGNPKIYSSENINIIVKKTFGNLLKETLEKKSNLEKLGYTVVSIWESDFKYKTKF